MALGSLTEAGFLITSLHKEMKEGQARPGKGICEYPDNVQRAATLYSKMSQKLKEVVISTGETGEPLCKLTFWKGRGRERWRKLIGHTKEPFLWLLVRR